jgi:hypothetical protein
VPGALTTTELEAVLAPLAAANRRLADDWPGDRPERQPVHTVYGGAHLFEANIARKLGDLALGMMHTYAPDGDALARALGLEGDRRLAAAVHERVARKLEREPVEDYRIDFEDGYGHRPDAEEDAAAERAAREVARGMRDGTLAPFIGIRVKAMSEELKRRAARTLDVFITTLAGETGGELPERFVVTLPKVAMVEQVAAFCAVLDALEARLGLARGTVRVELMVELTQALFDGEGRSNLPRLVRATGGRAVAAHFGTYDYTASANITAVHQRMDHPACDFAKHVMQVALSGSGIWLSDGATNVMPTPPHRGEALGDAERAENAAVVHRAWRTAYGHIRHSLAGGFYQGWDLHPGQLPVRYAACFAFFLEGLEAASERLRNFMQKAAQATVVGDVFDDAATGQGLLNYFLRAHGSGAITDEELASSGLTLDELRTRSFLRILEGRRARG